jgi:hypothetical protein
MTHLTIFQAVGVAVDTIVADAPLMDTGIGTHLEEFFLVTVMALSAVHYRRFFLFRGIIVMTVITGKVEAFWRSMETMFEDHRPAFGMQHHPQGFQGFTLDLEVVSPESDQSQSRKNDNQQSRLTAFN